MVGTGRYERRSIGQTTQDGNEMQLDGEDGIPQGLEEGTEKSRVVFERRRTKESKGRVKGKTKGLKDKDWILKKKEVRLLPSLELNINR